MGWAESERSVDFAKRARSTLAHSGSLRKTHNCATAHRRCHHALRGYVVSGDDVRRAPQPASSISSGGATDKHDDSAQLEPINTLLHSPGGRWTEHSPRICGRDGRCGAASEHPRRATRAGRLSMRYPLPNGRRASRIGPSRGMGKAISWPVPSTPILRHASSESRGMCISCATPARIRHRS